MSMSPPATAPDITDSPDGSLYSLFLDEVQRELVAIDNPDEAFEAVDIFSVTRPEIGDGSDSTVYLELTRVGPSQEGWVEYALCSETDPEAFYPKKGHRDHLAKEICRRCEVQDECLQFALENDEMFGVWGGVGERARRKMRAERDREAARETGRETVDRPEVAVTVVSLAS